MHRSRFGAYDDDEKLYSPNPLSTLFVAVATYPTLFGRASDSYAFLVLSNAEVVPTNRRPELSMVAAVEELEF
jgi:hypothetical protein